MRPVVVNTTEPLMEELAGETQQGCEAQDNGMMPLVDHSNLQVDNRGFAVGRLASLSATGLVLFGAVACFAVYTGSISSFGNQDQQANADWSLVVEKIDTNDTNDSNASNATNETNTSTDVNFTNFTSDGPGTCCKLDRDGKIDLTADAWGTAKVIYDVSLEDCEQRCEESDECVAFEFRDPAGSSFRKRCELHPNVPTSLECSRHKSVMPDHFTCYWKPLADGVQAPTLAPTTSTSTTSSTTTSTFRYSGNYGGGANGTCCKETSSGTNDVKGNAKVTKAQDVDACEEMCRTDVYCVAFEYKYSGTGVLNRCELHSNFPVLLDCAQHASIDADDFACFYVWPRKGSPEPTLTPPTTAAPTTAAPTTGAPTTGAPTTV
jgi:hypothetical protein